MREDFYMPWCRSFMERLALVAACVIMPALAMAQRYPFHNLNVDDGLVQSQAISLAQDQVGNLWIGTLGGLSRFDGKNFTNYTVQNGLKNNAVWSVGVDSQNNIWIGGQNCISKFNGQTFTSLKVPELPGRSFGNSQEIAIVGDTVWWRTRGAVFYVSGSEVKNFVTPGAPGSVSAMLVEKTGLWVAVDSAVYHYANRAWDTVKFNVPLGQHRPTIRSFLRDRAGAVWASSDLGLYRIEGGRFSPLRIVGDSVISAARISSMTQDRSGALWIACSKGVIKLAGNTIVGYSKHNGLSDNAFFDVVTDREGNVWMASDGQGIFRFSGTQFTVLDESMGLPSGQVTAIASNNKDSLFLGTYDAGLYVFTGGKVSLLDIPVRPAPSITTLCYSSRGKLWIGTRDHGLWTYQNGIFRQYAAPERSTFPSNSINSLYEDTAHQMWIGFVNGALMFGNDNFNVVLSRNLPVLSFLSIGHDSMLLATEAGLMLYYAGLVSDFTTKTILDSANIQCLVLKGRELWAGSSDKGVIMYDMSTGKTSVINRSQGMRSDFIYNITEDGEGNIWAGTGFGLHKITLREDGSVKVAFYGKGQGVAGMESNMNAVLKLKDNSIWFGTTNGALHYQPQNAVVSTGPVAIVLQSVKLAGETTMDRRWFDSLDTWYGIPYNLRLPYKFNNISFTFQAVALTGAQQLMYRYMIDGLETPWSAWSPVNSVSYSALPPGKYIFRVQCRGNDEQDTKELAYPFEVVAPFQKTYWFRLATLFACILAGILFQYIVNSRKQRRLKLLEKLREEELNKIRLRTAEDFHDEIGNKLTRINVLTSVLKSKIALTPDTERILGQIEENTHQLYGGTRDILWSLKPSNDNLFELLQRISDFGGELFQDADVNFNFTGIDEKWRKFRLPMDTGRNLIMIFKEALNNSLKYSKAANVTIDASIKNRNVLHLVLRDDGLGFDASVRGKGNGITNMHTRAGRLNGRLYIDSRKGKGTIISLTFKVPITK